VRAGGRYIAMVRGWRPFISGPYGFRAYFSNHGLLPADEHEPNDEPSQATWIEIGTPQQHTFHHADDVDWVKFEVTRPGRHTIRARGVYSNLLDTYIELFDENLNLIAEDDDGGEDFDSRLSLFLDRGIYYLKVWFVGDEPDQPYIISIEAR